MLYYAKKTLAKELIFNVLKKYNCGKIITDKFIEGTHAIHVDINR